MGRRRKKGLTLGKTRSGLYKAARGLGDVSAVSRGPMAIIFRLLNRTIGRMLSRVFLGR